MAYSREEARAIDEAFASIALSTTDFQAVIDAGDERERLAARDALIAATRPAYHARIRELHPDHGGPGGAPLHALRLAWSELGAWTPPPGAAELARLAREAAERAAAEVRRAEEDAARAAAWAGHRGSTPVGDPAHARVWHLPFKIEIL